MKKLLLLFALVLTVCSTVKAQEESLTMLSPVGTIGTLDGREAMVVDLGGDIGMVAIATMNVGATSIDDAGKQFYMTEANAPANNGLTDGWYVPSADELIALCAKLEANDSQPGLKWKVSDASTLYFPAYQVALLGYCGMYVSSSSDYRTMVFTYENSVLKTKTVAPMANPENIGWSVIRPFHKLPTAYSYVYPVYNAPNDVTKGIEKWETGKVSAIEVTSSTEPVTWGEAGKTTWYVVTGEDVILSKGAICAGDVNLILADGAKLTANGVEKQAGINVSEFDSNYGYTHLAIYGQAAQSGELEANGGAYGAGIGGGYEGFGMFITINGGTVTATGGIQAAGIGGGRKGFGSNIIINGGTVTANAGVNGAGIGGGLHCPGLHITVNGGTVTANGGNDAAGIGGGYKAEDRSYAIFVANILTLKANDDVIENNGEDLAESLADKRYVTIESLISASYVYPLYNDPEDVTKGVKDWGTETVNAIEVTSSNTPVTWGEAGKTTWYVVTGDVILSAGAVCEGAVNLILADGAKLTATGTTDETNDIYTPGIQVTDGYTFTTYGQTAQSGQLIAIGGEWAAGIGGGNEGSGSNITINGGTVTANGGTMAAGIGGGNEGSGSNITINGGTVTANGGDYAAGIGGGNSADGSNITINGGIVIANGDTGAGIGGGNWGSGSNITINGGTVTANGGRMAAGIGGGNRGTASYITINGGTITATGGENVLFKRMCSGIGKGDEGAFPLYIFVDPSLVVKAGTNYELATVVENDGGDIAGYLSANNQKYVTITPSINLNITANQDPNHKQNYYAMFYSSAADYQVPEYVIAYTGAVDGSVLKLTAIENGIIPAGEAVILRLTTENNTATKQQITLSLTSETVTKSNTNVLTGTNAKMTLGANDYALSLGQNGVGFYLWEGKEIGANKAYLSLGSVAGAKAFTFQFEDEITGINDPQLPTLNSQPTYNLNGVRVNDNYKGIVIKNGKKIYQK